MFKNRTLLTIIILLNGSFSLGYASNGTGNQRIVKIAYCGGLSGRDGQSAQRSLTALRLAAQKYNKSGGLLGSKIQIVPYDTESLALGSISAVRRAKADGAVAITGFHISNQALAIADIAEREHIPIVVASATHPEISKNKQYVVQVCFTDDVQGKKLGIFARQKLKSRKLIPIVDMSDSASIRVATAFKSTFSDRGGMVLPDITVHDGQQDYSETLNIIQKIRDLDAIFISAPAVESSYLIAQILNAGIRIPMIGTDNWQNDNLSKALSSLGQKQMLGYFPAHWYIGVNSAESRQFIKLFNSASKENISSFDADPALAFDAGVLLFEAIRVAGSFNSKAIAKHLHKIKIRGVTGKIVVTKRGFPKKDFFIMKFKNSDVSLVEVE